MSRLLDRLLADDLLAQAWLRVRDNDGTAGIDGVSIAEFADNAFSRLARLRDQVRDGRYQPRPWRRIALHRAGRTPRYLSVPSIGDRVLQTAAALVMTPIIDRQLEDASYAYRPGRSVRQAVARVAELRDAGFVHIADSDVSAFFDNIPSARLLARVASVLPDRSLLPLLRQWLAAPVQTDEGTCQPLTGIAQGSPLSPLLANLYLDEFDEMIAAVPDRHLIRYGDDFVILCRDAESAERALEDASHWLADAGLALNFDKTRTATFQQGLSFLGVHFDAQGQRAEDPDATAWLLPPELRPAHCRAPAPPSPPVRAAPLSGNAVLRAVENPPSRAHRLRFDEAPAPLLRTLYLAEPGVFVRCVGGRLRVEKDGEELLSVPMEKIDQLLIADEGAISFAALRTLVGQGAGLLLQGRAGEALGVLGNAADRRVELRRSQFRRSEDDDFRLAAARAIVAGKLANSRLLLRRYYRFRPGGQSPVDSRLRELQSQVWRAERIEALRGLEGAAARTYFEGFAGLLPAPWTFPGRQRQPPTDPVNALLSYGYGVLFQNLLTLLAERGLDPHIGSLHAIGDGHPALVSDLIEEFRALTVDAVVLRLLTQGDVEPGDFSYDDDGACRLGRPLRKTYLAALEAKLQSPVEHRLAGGGDYRRAMRAQVAHWIQVLEGSAPLYRPFMPR